MCCFHVHPEWGENGPDSNGLYPLHLLCRHRAANVQVAPDPLFFLLPNLDFSTNPKPQHPTPQHPTPQHPNTPTPQHPTPDTRHPTPNTLRYSGHTSAVLKARFSADDKYLVTIDRTDQCVITWQTVR